MAFNLRNPSVGVLVRDWRERRRLSQFEAASDAAISTRHLSFIETNRARPSREVIVRLSECLDVPLGDRNALLLAAGYAPMYSATPLYAPEMEPIAKIIAAVLETVVPTVVVDRYWNIVDMNANLRLIVEGVAPHLLEAPANALRIALHPDGLAPRITNLTQWRDHLLDRLRREARASADPKHYALLEELRRLSAGPEKSSGGVPELAVPLRLIVDGEELEFISTIATFGTPVDVTVSNLMIETFFPGNDTTRRVLSSHAVT